MRTLLVTLSFLLPACLFASCSSARECTSEDNYRIEYFTGGGFTGVERGMTIECSGTVHMWERKVNEARVVTDSLTLNTSSLKIFDTAMNDTTVFSYARKDASNHTATLTLSKRNRNNSISYNSTAAPADLPASVRAILAEIITIHK